ncbi:MAG: transglutaminase-like domain-containing protein, partial [Spirochaetaceae bacterium]|nr:transglutaminase-like domain-containing protein [Spirochaetaceae bacterium]
MRTQCACNGSPAFFLRSAACFMLLYQAAFIAGELARGPLFCAALVQAFALGCALAMYGAALGGGGRFSAPCALAIMLAVPHAVRAAFALARVFAYMHAGAATAAASSAAAFLPFDALLLAYDRAAFVFVLPFYWFAITSYFALRSAKAVRRAAFADIVLFCLMFTVWKSGAISVYKWPVLKLFVFCAVLFLELLAISLATLARARQNADALAPSGFGRGAVRAERVSVCGLLVLLAVISGGALFKPLNERELESGGGLLQSKLFSFDFAPFLRLENEITMNDDLVFIVRKKSEAPAGRLDDDWLSGADFFSDLPDLYAIEDRHSLMRRFVLSAYDSKNGFTRSETVDERAQRRALPAAKMTRDAGPEKKRALLEQEYYMVNIDSEALIAISEPRQVALFERWNASSFKSAYKVESLTSEATRRDLAQAAFPAAGLGAAGLSAEDLAWYTAFADPKKGPGATEKRIQDLSLALSGHTENYWEKIQSLFLYLKYGDYLYSLKPGIAPDGDQLAYFLFDGKKGYCSYFAFAFASMLRSIGVPCRVAVGFYSDNSAERLGFYPVTANMAHAWVEVWFPEYGWIEYDPTTEQYAPDEQWSFGSPPPDELLERLMKEILDNHAALTEKAAPPPAAGRQTGTLREQAA